MATKFAMKALVAVGLVACSVVLVVLLSSCGGEKPAVDLLAGTEWQVQSYDSPQAGGLTSPLAGTQLTAKWDAGQVGGTAGCNSFAAAYKADGDSLSVEAPVATKMSCSAPPGIMEQETAFLADLQSARRFTSTSAQLQIFNDAGNVVLVFVPYTGPLPEPTATPAPATPTPPEATQTPAAVDNSWDRIQAAGTIVVGTSSGYPPFEYYVGPDLDGFDIALMNKIGDELGLRVDYKDLDSDGLVQGLIDGNIDAVIAHVAWTPDREEQVDFSTVYYVDRPAALALANSTIKLTALEDLTKYRVGVQNGSIYETKMKELFDKAGLLAVDYVSGYVDAERAIEGLEKGQVDVVVMHNQAALAFVKQGGVKEVGVAETPLYLAIALPQGQATLKAEIDDVLKALDEDGTISELAKRYMGEDTLEPTPTPAPTTQPKPTSTPKPGPTPECSNRMEMVNDPAVGEVKPAKAFTKTWQVKNTGTCTWSQAYQLVFVSGEKMNGKPLPVAGQVKGGATYEFRLELVAPVDEGTHTGLWQMADAKGTLFGEKLKVSAFVPAPPTSTPTPTPTPPPYVKIWADAYHIKAGASTYIRWQVEQVKQYWVYREDQRWQDHPGAGNQGEKQVQPSQTTTWYLRVEYLSAQVDTLPCTITVDQPPPTAPKILQFTVDALGGSPPGQAWLGEALRIRWTIDGQVSEARLIANGVLLDTRTDGSLDHTPEALGPVEYQIWATGPGGTDTRLATVTVLEPVVPITPEPPPDDPLIYNFNVSPNEIQVGNCVNIIWSVGGGTTIINILRDGAVILESGNFDGQQTECLDQPADYAYQLRAANAVTQVLSDPQTVSVREAPPEEPPLAGTHWMVTALYDGAGNPISILLDAPPTASFGRNGRVDGSAGCSSYSAKYRAAGDVLTITALTSSVLDCSAYPDLEALMAQDAAFLAALPMAANFRLDGQQLTVLGPTGQTLMQLNMLLQ